MWRAYVANFDGKLWNIVCKYVEYVDKECGEDLMIVKGDFKKIHFSELISGNIFWTGNAIFKRIEIIFL